MGANTASLEVLKHMEFAKLPMPWHQAHLCVLASNRAESVHVKLVEALWAEQQINLLKVQDNRKLGGWAGLCKIDRERKPCRVVGGSCVVVENKGNKESQGCHQRILQMQRMKK